MTPERLAEIKARAEAATPGPRRVTTDGGHVELNPSEGDYAYIPCESRDAAHIAHSRQDILDLVAEVERLRCAIDELDDAKDTVAHYRWCSEVIKAVRTWPQGQYGMRLKR